MEPETKKQKTDDNTDDKETKANTLIELGKKQPFGTWFVGVGKDSVVTTVTGSNFTPPTQNGIRCALRRHQINDPNEEEIERIMNLARSTDTYNRSLNGSYIIQAILSAFAGKEKVLYPDSKELESQLDVAKQLHADKTMTGSLQHDSKHPWICVTAGKANCFLDGVIKNMKIDAKKLECMISVIDEFAPELYMPTSCVKIVVVDNRKGELVTSEIGRVIA